MFDLKLSGVTETMAKSPGLDSGAWEAYRKQLRKARRRTRWGLRWIRFKRSLAAMIDPMSHVGLLPPPDPAPPLVDLAFVYDGHRYVAECPNCDFKAVSHSHFGQPLFTMKHYCFGKREETA